MKYYLFILYWLPMFAYGQNINIDTIVIEYWPNGKIRSEQQHKIIDNGYYRYLVNNGYRKMWDEEGYLTRHDSMYDDSDKAIYQEFRRSGQMYRKEQVLNLDRNWLFQKHIVADKKINGGPSAPRTNFWVYNEANILRNNVIWDTIKNEAIQRKYYDDGKLESEGKIYGTYDPYLDVFPKHGLWKFYNQAGDVYCEQYFDKGKLVRKTGKNCPAAQPPVFSELPEDYTLLNYVDYKMVFKHDR